MDRSGCTAVETSCSFKGANLLHGLLLNIMCLFSLEPFLSLPSLFKRWMVWQGYTLDTFSGRKALQVGDGRYKSLPPESFAGIRALFMPAAALRKIMKIFP